jgi:hypothetical protein
MTTCDENLARILTWVNGCHDAGRSYTVLAGVREGIRVVSTEWGCGQVIRISDTKAVIVLRDWSSC